MPATPSILHTVRNDPGQFIRVVEVAFPAEALGLSQRTDQTQSDDRCLTWVSFDLPLFPWYA